MNTIQKFYKYQPIGPGHDLLCFEEIPQIDNPCRLIQVDIYDIELTAWIREKELQINIQERGRQNYNDLRIPSNDPVQALHEMERVFHIMSLKLGPAPVQVLGRKRSNWTRRHKFPYCHSDHVMDPHRLPRFTIGDECHYLQRRKYENQAGIYDGAMLTIMDENRRDREGLYDGIYQ